MKQERAVTYNRCSTEEESQKDALVKQVQESKNCVYEQGWKLMDTYVEAKSGTTVKGRSEYNRLYRDLELDKFDIIVIKSQDRLMRNTKDWYLFLDRMQKNRKKLYMYLEGKFYTPDDALITGIKAILAEEYSRELSKKINNAHKNRQKEGKSFVFTNQMYGLKKLPDKTIVIDEREAEMIRMIFRLSANGYGTHTSAEILYKNGYTNRNGKMLTPSLIRNIIRNPIYKGTVVQNKRHYEFESKQTVNNPKSEWIVHEDVVPAIVDEELFEEANRALDYRKREGHRDGKFVRYSSIGSHDLSGKIICGLCEEPFYRTVRRNKSGKVIEWKCSNYLHHGRKADEMRRDQIRKTDKGEDAGCDNVHLDEKKLSLCLEQVCGQKLYRLDQKEILEEMLSLLRKALGDNSPEEKRETLTEELQKAEYQKNILLEKLLDGVIDNRIFQRKDKELQDKIDHCMGKIKQLEDDTLQNTRLEERLEMIKERLEQGVIQQAQMAEILSEITKILVYPDHMEICFDSWALLWIEEMPENLMGREGVDQLAVITVPQNCSTSHQPMMEAEKVQIISLMQDDPKITAKKIAEKMGVNLSLVLRRINALKADGKIYYSSSNGRGEWVIVDSDMK
ncbi:MAG: recombinase family protein [Lachnospiraceae bacterium]|nr:recombinase family protein [Lachnospiraceae bacterium]